MDFHIHSGFEILLTSVLGLILGSFATAMAARIPEGRSWIFEKSKASNAMTRSACMHCKKRLKFFDLIPVFSFLFQKGACRQCGEKISATYPMIEVATTLLCLVAYSIFAWTVPFFWIAALSPFLVALVVIDLKHYTLPNQLVLVIGVIGALRLLVQFDVTYVLGACAYGALAFLIGKIVSLVLKKEALGFGDVKLFAVCGLWLGLSNLPAFLILSGFLGVVLGMIWRYYTKTQIFPFGPAIIASFLLLLLTQGGYPLL